MKVNNCINCPFSKEKRWHSTYKPAGYHTIGISHRYHYCEKFQTRCLQVKKCNLSGGVCNEKIQKANF